MKHIIENFIPAGGKHCITNALKQIFCYYDHPISEEVLFGTASGLAFMYINLSNSPMVSGRTKPFEFERKLAERINITIKCKQPKHYEVAFSQAKKLIDNNCPVLIYADMPFMKYLGLNENSHFGGHAVVLFGYDDESGMFYVSDRDNDNSAIRTPHGDISNDYHLVSYDEMETARSSNFRPFPANNKYLQFDFSNFKEVNSDTIITAVADTCETMLNPPAHLLGINGISKFAKEILKWRKFDKQKLKTAGITNYFQISRDGGTGGGIFRKMYGDFLIEADGISPGMGFMEIGEAYVSLSEKWDLLADAMWQLGELGNESILKSMSEQILDLYEIEKF